MIQFFPRQEAHSGARRAPRAGDTLTVIPSNVSVKFFKQTEELKVFYNEHPETQQMLDLHHHESTHLSVRLSLHQPIFYFMHFKINGKTSVPMISISQSPTSGYVFSCKFRRW